MKDFRFGVEMINQKNFLKLCNMNTVYLMLSAFNR